MSEKAQPPCDRASEIINGERKVRPESRDRFL